MGTIPRFSDFVANGLRSSNSEACGSLSNAKLFEQWIEKAKTDDIPVFGGKVGDFGVEVGKYVNKFYPLDTHTTAGVCWEHPRITMLVGMHNNMINERDEPYYWSESPFHADFAKFPSSLTQWDDKLKEMCEAMSQKIKSINNK